MEAAPQYLHLGAALVLLVGSFRHPFGSDLEEASLRLPLRFHKFQAACLMTQISTLSIKCDWLNAIKYADILRKQCAWSPAIYCYQSAIFMHMMMDETGDERLREKINELYREVPKLRIRYAGKTIPGW